MPDASKDTLGNTQFPHILDMEQLGCRLLQPQDQGRSLKWALREVPCKKLWIRLSPGSQVMGKYDMMQIMKTKHVN